jgi:hypothetical protein
MANPKPAFVRSKRGATPLSIVPPDERPVEETTVSQGLKVLLLGESAQGVFYLLRRLELLGCDCRFATSTEGAMALMDRHNFQLILSTLPLHEIDPLLPLLSESHCTVFCSYPVQDSCWWLPFVRHGQKCLGAPAFRPNEFTSFLGQLIKDIGLNEVMTQASESL